MRNPSLPSVLRGAFVLAVAATVLAAGATVVAAAPSSEGKAARADVVVDVNTASEKDLQSVPGIGPALAKRIVEFRDEHGAFERVDDLLKVRGIGEKSLVKLRPHLTVGKSR